MEILLHEDTFSASFSLGGLQPLCVYEDKGRPFWVFPKKELTTLLTAVVVNNVQKGEFLKLLPSFCRYTAKVEFSDLLENRFYVWTPDIDDDDEILFTGFVSIPERKRECSRGTDKGWYFPTSEMEKVFSVLIDAAQRHQWAIRINGR